MHTSSSTQKIRTRTPRVERLRDIPPVTTWPAPLTDGFDSSTFTLYGKNRLAVELYVSESRADEIKRRTGYSIAKARKLTERCLGTSKQTRTMNGFWACVPGRNLPSGPHKRRAPVDAKLAADGRGLKGALQSLFKLQPGIENALINFIQFRCLPGQAPVPLIDYKGLVTTFHVLCRAAGVREDQWPFNTKKLGENAIYEWWKRTRALYPMQTIENQFGDKAIALAGIDVAAVHNEVSAAVYKAYERLEMDEHLIHGMFNVGFPNRKGTMNWVATARFWVLAIRDKRTGAVLASSVSYRQKYDSNDVLKLIKRALMPPPKRQLSFQNLEFRYGVDATFPAELPEFKLNTWMEHAWDNDRCHLSIAEKGRIEDVVGCRVKFEKLGIPVEREAIEGFFARFADEAQRLPTGTGGNYQDPARRDPEAAAKSLKLYAHHIEEVWDVYCRNWNGRPSTKCGGVSPLQLMKELNVEGNAFISPLGELGPNNLFKLLPRYPATLTRRRGAFGPFRVALFGASYSSPELAFDKRLSYASNLAVTVYVEEDARFAFVVPEAHPEMVFPVTVIDKDLKGFTHSLEWRRIAEAATKNSVDRGTATGPALMMGLVRSLADGAQENVPGAANQLAGITAFMSAAGYNEIEYVMSANERAQLLDAVDTGTDTEADDAQVLEEIRESPTPAPRQETKSALVIEQLDPSPRVTGPLNFFNPF